MTDIDWRVLKANADAERAQLNRILADIRDTINTSAESTLLQANATSTLTTEQGLSGMATAWRDTNARVTRNGNNITALAEDITFLSARVDDIESGETGNAEAISLLTARVEANEQGITSLAQDYTLLTARVDDIDSSQSGLAEAVDDLSVRVTSNEDGIEANANSLLKLGALTSDGSAFLLNSGTVLVSPSQSLAQWRTELNTSLDGKANSSTVTALSNTVSQQGDTITAHGTQLSGLSATVGGNSASINELREVAVSALAGNSLINPSFEDGDKGWSTVDGIAYVYDYGEFARTGSKVLRFNGSGSDVWIRHSSMVPAPASREVGAGLFVRFGPGGRPNGGARLIVSIRGYDVGGNYVPGSASNIATIGGEQTELYYQKVGGRYQIPDGVVSLLWQVGSTGQTQGSFMVDDAYLEPITNGVAEMLAKYTLAVQAGGDIAGIQLLAGGGISAFRVLASMFQIVDPGGTGGYTHSAGVSIWRIGSAMIAIGPGFGAGNEFIFWAGPDQSNLNNCTRANAGMYFTRTNDAYFGGTLTAGALYHPSQATFTAYPLNVYTEVGPFVSNGGTKRVTSQFRYHNSGTVAGDVTGGHGQRFDGLVTISRRIGTGSWSVVNTYPVTGVKSAIYNPGANRTTVNTVISGSVSYDDTNSSSSDFSYRAQITSLDNPTVGGVPVEGEVTIASKEA